MQTCADLGVGKARLTRRRGFGVRDNVTPDHMSCLSRVCLCSISSTRTHTHRTNTCPPTLRGLLVFLLFSRRINWVFPPLRALVSSGKKDESPDVDDSGRMGPNLVFGRTRLVGRLHLVRVLLHRFPARCRDGHGSKARELVTAN